METRTLNVAIKRAIEINQAIEDRGQPMEAAISKGRVTFAEVAEEYLRSRALRERSARKHRAILAVFTRLAAEKLGKPALLLHEVDAGLVQRYVAARLHEPTTRNGHPNTRKSLAGASPKTVLGERDLIADILRFAVQRRLLASMPSLGAAEVGIKVKEAESFEPRPLSQEEARQLVAAAKRYDAAQLQGRWPYATYFADLVAAFLLTGLRLGEMQHLRWDDIDLGDGTIAIKAKRVTFTREVRLSAEAIALLERRIGGRPADGRLLPETPKFSTR